EPPTKRPRITSTPNVPPVSATSQLPPPVPNHTVDLTEDSDDEFLNVDLDTYA
ncbi:unnamed protein product, partial [Allacma fusca]